MLTTLWLLIAVVRLAAHRFMNPSGIHAAVGSERSSNAAVLQALVQNTLEQTILAIVAYGAWLWFGPAERLGVVVVFSGYFAVGRVFFFAAYSHGAPARALGFSLTFYPSVVLYLALLPATVSQLFSV